MKKYEVIVTGQFVDFFPAADIGEAEAEMRSSLPSWFEIDAVEVIEL